MACKKIVLVIVEGPSDDVTAYAKSQHYKSSDFKQIIHIVDMDGTYIPNENVIEIEDREKIRYEKDGIYTSDKESIVIRNEQKRDNLYRLRTCGIIWSIPYRVYYMSSNLDHVLYDKRNSTNEDKENDAYAFAKKYKNQVEEFIRYMCYSTFSVCGDYKEFEFNRALYELGNLY